MFVIVETQHGRKERKWTTFPSAPERDRAFVVKKSLASRSGCGPQCGCFWDGGNYFYHCGNTTVAKVPTFKMKE